MIYRWLAVNWIDCVGYWQAVTWPVLWHSVAYSYLTHWCLYVRVLSYLLFIPCFHDMPAAYYYHCDRFCIRRAERMCRCETTEMCRMGLKSFCGFFKWMRQISLIWLDFNSQSIIVHRPLVLIQLCLISPPAAVPQAHCPHFFLRISFPGIPAPKFTDDLMTILRQFSDLRQSYDNWWIHRTFMIILRPILRQNLMISC